MDTGTGENFSAVLQSFGAGLAPVARMPNFKKVSVDSVDVWNRVTMARAGHEWRSSEVAFDCSKADTQIRESRRSCRSNSALLFLNQKWIANSPQFRHHDDWFPISLRYLQHVRYSKAVIWCVSYRDAPFVACRWHPILPAMRSFPPAWPKQPEVESVSEKSCFGGEVFEVMSFWCFCNLTLT